MSRPRIGVLALQGDVREHCATLTRCGADVVGVRREHELVALDGLVLPGGESTAIVNLARIFGLLEPLRTAVVSGLPVLGTCAGMVLLADRLVDAMEGQQTVGGLDVTVRRNGFGRQVDSFEQDLEMAGVEGPVHAVFIRAPWVEEAGADVEVLARVPDGAASGRIVAVRQGALMATSFHPEVGGDPRVHRSFLDLVHGT
ncbi:pyridoxal 5'-phosphate synthase glutaminase subunit PdxT [Nocardioides jishulii]|uniref:Pyridoxal 5'-phosphate synthase subunit PdxT n=1 Tax=Nocardioides jishulii TaxID=2575440 RepID=A0A4U2YN18_9ACTN|nr:pyridoxal 5'-phosphate synthase glutaminase subunit PdxT [Nocardioides jishulii]QCX27428.1 pyridoxal 5'-phosphate synthase glutaminase subunit PdxT [Nocardioides jishulii]TKI62234.1 pyridoxal 5'-phosphate synthase glutaminase subunit PdxT [Nocardioides jishulii]